MRDTSISKTVFFGVVVGGKLVDMAMAETDTTLKMYFFWGVFALIVLYWAKQTFLDYTGRKKE